MPRDGLEDRARLAQKIVGRGGDYVLAPEANRSVLHIVHKDIDLSQPTASNGTRPIIETGG
jgi:hypothetical protein